MTEEAQSEGDKCIEGRSQVCDITQPPQECVSGERVDARDNLVYMQIFKGYFVSFPILGIFLINFDTESTSLVYDCMLQQSRV